jgi:hypothetical protein
MSFETDFEKHKIEIRYDPTYGIQIIGLICPHEKKIKAIQMEINIYHLREARRYSGAYFTIELIEKILTGEYFKK